MKPNLKIDRRLMGVGAMNPFDAHDSASRKQMYLSSHLSQCLVINGSTERRIQSGAEREFGKYTFSIKMPADGVIVRVIERYKKTPGRDSISKNPQTIIIYENAKTREFDVIDVCDFHSLHQHFGFRYRPTRFLQNVRRGAAIPEGTILLNSPAINDRGGYQYGRECNVAFMSHPAVAEDGIMISRDVLPQFGFKTKETRIVEFGSTFYPILHYKSGDVNKAFPDIGDVIGPDNILIALRRHSVCNTGQISNTNALSIAEMSVRDMKKVDHFSDRVYYAGGPGGRIIDIRVYHDAAGSSGLVPVELEEQAHKYNNATRVFYREILEEYERMKRERGEQLRISPALHRLVVEAIAMSGNNEAKIKKEFKKNPLDEWRIEFDIEYDIIPDIGFKFTDCHGGKGVNCRIAEPHEMPVDAHGNRADIVMDGNATVDRMNWGRLYEQYINAASRDLVKNITSMLESGNPSGITEANPMFNHAWEMLIDYYSMISTRMLAKFTSPNINRVAHLQTVVKNGIYLYIPPENEISYPDMVRAIEKKYPPLWSPVTYVDMAGRKVTTKLNVRIGSIYVILLEKTGDDWTAVSSGVLQHFGVLGPIPKSMKYTRPVRMQPVRAIGESEARIYVSYAGSDITADIMDRNNSAVSHAAMVDSILSADKPSNIEKGIDRQVYPLGKSKPLQIVKHVLGCAGAEFFYKKSDS